MTVVHIVLVKIKADLTAEKIEQFKESTHGLAANAELKPLYSEFKWGAPAFDARAKGYNWGLFSVFPDRDTLQKYSLHPVHVEFVKNVMKTQTEDLLAYDFEI